MIAARARRFALVQIAVAVLLATASLAWCAAASAHVTVQPTQAAGGSETTFTFRVPNERSDASTVKIVLALPTTPAIAAVSVQPIPGWQIQPTTRDLAEPVQTDDGPVRKIVARVTWTAAGKTDAIAPGQFQQFVIAAGPLPQHGVLLFKVLQYYSDGTVVRWIDPPQSGDEPAHPAPAVTLGTGGPRPSAAGDGGGDGWIAVAAFVAALLGFAAGTAALVVARRGSRAAP